MSSELFALYLGVITLPGVIIPLVSLPRSTTAAEANFTSDRSRLAAGRTPASSLTDFPCISPAVLLYNAFPDAVLSGERSQNALPLPE